MWRRFLSAESRPAWFTAVGVAAVFLIAFFLTWPFVDPAPPGRIRLATGLEGGFYAALGARYKTALEDHNIEVDLVATNGSGDNLRLLTDDAAGVDFAFLQGGISHGVDTAAVEGVASIALEPVWLFTSAAAPLTRLGGLDGKTLAVGPPGSGSRALAEAMLGAAGLAGRVTLSPLSGMAAADALRQGKVDAALFVTSSRTASVAGLLRDPAVSLVQLERVEALALALPYLTVITLPEGAISLPDNIPSRPMRLIGTATGIAAAEGVHPALVALMLDVAHGLHGAETVYGQRDLFPSPLYMDFPLSAEAHRYFKNGPSFLQRYLPFWAANMVDRLWVLIIPLLTIMLPLMRVAPPVYRWQMRRRIYRWYRTLQEIEVAWWESGTDETRTRLLEDLNALQAEVGHISVPLSYQDEFYRLRTHIQFVEDLIRSGRQLAVPGAHAGEAAATAKDGAARRSGPVPAHDPARRETA